jgi:hypothetical protein
MIASAVLLFGRHVRAWLPSLIPILIDPLREHLRASQANVQILGGRTCKTKSRLSYANDVLRFVDPAILHVQR